MAEKDIILIISDNKIDPLIIQAMEQDGYSVMQENPSDKTCALVANNINQLAAVILDLAEPTKQQKILLDMYHDIPDYNHIPLVIISQDDSKETELSCLKHGAWDFIIRSSHYDILRLRINNAIHHSTLPLLRQLRHVINYDAISGIYNKNRFFDATRKMLSENPNKKFALVHFDIEKFRLINAFFGSKEGDNFIVYIAHHLKRYNAMFPLFTYGHIGADVFAFCMNFEDKIEIVTLANKIREQLQKYSLPFTIIPVLGISIITDNSTDINQIFDQANLASKNCHGNFLKHYAFYDPSMNEEAIHDQYIVNNMVRALENRQFVVYLQPKYDLRTNTVDGAEALVRWQHPERGMIPPNEFIPVFERNGFISRLDYYVWDNVCHLIRRWMDEGKEVYPISVNVSRVDLFNPKIVDIICNLADKYCIPHNLLQLELTESAYTSNPFVIKEMMNVLREKNFTILMDDFGTGYSSLNVLKDIVVDVLKIDMRFMSDCETPGRGENILGSIVRMAKWLDLPVIAEGVETETQVNFLRNIGCEYVQGYYFARPMTIADFEKIAFTNKGYFKPQDSEDNDISADALWSATSQMEALFSNILQAMVLCEFDGNNVEILRENDAYHDMFGYHETRILREVFENTVSQEELDTMFQAFKSVAETHGTAECDFCVRPKNNNATWINAKLKYINSIGTKNIVLTYLADITSQKIIDLELQKYRTALSASQNEQLHVLIVDDEEVNRVILSNIFKDDFTIAEAENAKQALEILQQKDTNIDLILLDLVMPEMNGVTFLQEKRKLSSIANIPVIIITADDSPEQQSRLLDMGVKDYILKPFVPVVVRQRVTNVVESIRSVGEKLQNNK